MDQNLDLLKSENHNSTREFLDTILNNGLWPTITRPTRITQTSATLIDNIYVRRKLQYHFDSLVLLDDLSDHLPTVALLRQIKVSDKSPIAYQSRRLNDTKIDMINQQLRNIDWNGVLNSEDVNTNTQTFMKKLESAMDTVAPLQTI